MEQETQISFVNDNKENPILDGLAQVGGFVGGADAADGWGVVGVGDQGGEDSVNVRVCGRFGGYGELSVLVGKIDGFEQNDDVSYGRAVLLEAFRSFTLDAYILKVEEEEVGYALAHLGGDGYDLRAVHDEDAVEVDDLVAGESDFFERGLQKNGGVGVLPLGVGGREEGADVSGGNGSKEGVGDGVK